MKLKLTVTQVRPSTDVDFWSLQVPEASGLLAEIYAIWAPHRAANTLTDTVSRSADDLTHTHVAIFDSEELYNAVREEALENVPTFPEARAAYCDANGITITQTTELIEE